jgi:hypothetical protein
MALCRRGSIRGQVRQRNRPRAVIERPCMGVSVDGIHLRVRLFFVGGSLAFDSWDRNQRNHGPHPFRPDSYRVDGGGPSRVNGSMPWNEGVHTMRGPAQHYTLPGFTPYAGRTHTTRRPGSHDALDGLTRRAGRVHPTRGADQHRARNEPPRCAERVHTIR